MAEGIILTDAELVELNKKIDKKSNVGHTHAISDVSNLQTTLNKKASASSLSSLETKVDKKVSSGTVKNIAIIEKGASTTNIPANTLIFEKE